MPETPIRGDGRSQSPRTPDALWSDDLTRRRKPGPQLHPRLVGAHDSTICVHAGTRDDPTTGAVGTPIYQCSTFLLDEEQYQSIEEGYARDRFVYSRYGNPSQWALQEKLATLEGSESALVFSSGMAAIATTVLSLLEHGGHVVTSFDLYGGTYNFFQHELPNFGMSATFVDPRDHEAIQAAIRPETQLLFFEAMSNPLLKVLDLDGLATIADEAGLRFVVDATFATPIGVRPLEHGADMVVHSGSKYLNGHSDLIAGVACGPRKLVDMAWGHMLNFGGSLDPHACFLFERGLKTLALRMAAHASGAAQIAAHLEAHPKVKRVFYPGLTSHPDHALAQAQQGNMGGMVTFVVQGGDAAALQLGRDLKFAKEATSLGGVESLVSLPFNTSHASLTQKRRTAMGIDPGCVRLSVGIEDPCDLIADLDAALSRIPT